MKNKKLLELIQTAKDFLKTDPVMIKAFKKYNTDIK